MKKFRILLIVSLLLCLNVSPSWAQHHRRTNTRQFDLELRAGANFSQIDGDNSANFDKLGFHAAVNTSFPISDDGNWRFLIELGLTQKGSNIKNSTLDRTISLLYVEVPIMLAYDFLEQHQLRAAIGVAPAILAHAKVTSDGAYDAAQSENYKRFDALPFCLSLRYRFNQHIGADIRFYNSLLNTAIENHTGTYRIFRSNKGQFNRLLQAGITLSF